MNSKILSIAVFAVFLFMSNVILGQVVNPDFLPVIKGSPRVLTLMVQPDDKTIIGGEFIVTGNTRVNGLARLNPDGTLDESFNLSYLTDNSENYVSTLFYDKSIDKIYVGGNFPNAKNLFRINYDGSIDESFNLNVDIAQVLKIDKQADGKLIVYSYSYPEYRLARIDDTGSLDQSFNSNIGPNNPASSDDLKVLSNDKIVVAGSFNEFNGTVQNKIVMLNSDGTIDNSFNIGTGPFSSTFAQINSVSELPDGDILISGVFSKFNEIPANGVVRLNPDGSIDSKFPLPGVAGSLFNSKFTIQSVTDSVGKTYLAGIDPFNNEFITIRLDSTGALDPTFLQGNLPIDKSFGNLLPPVIAVNSINQLYIGSAHSHYNNVLQNGISKVDSNGSLITNFNAYLGGKATIFSSIKLDNGKILIGGEFIFVGDSLARNLAMLNADGTLDQLFQNNIGTGPNKKVTAITTDMNGNFLVGGIFNGFNNDNTRSSLIRIDPTGVLDLTFDPKIVVKYAGLGVHALKVQPDNKILVGGLFDWVNTTNIYSLARLNEDGSIDNTFNSNNVLPINTWIVDIDLQLGGEVIVAGNYTFTQGVYSGSVLKRFNLNGDEDLSFDTSYDLSGLSLTDIAILPNNSILAGAADNQTYSNFPLLQFDSIGSILDDISVSVGSNQTSIQTIEPIDNQNVLIGGQFTSVNNVQVDGFAKVGLNGSVDTEFSYQFTKIGNYTAPFVQGMQYIGSDTLLVYGGFASVENTDVYSIAIINLLAPLAPSNLVAQFNFSTGVTLSWIDNSSKETGFEVYRSVDGINFSLIGSVNSNVSSYVDTSVELNKEYTYKVRAINNDLYSGDSNSNTLHIDDLVTPSNLSSDFDFVIGLQLSWDDNSTFEDSVEVYKSIDSLSFVLVESLSPNTTTLVDSDVELNTKYFYKIRLKAGIFESIFSETLVVTIPESAFLATPNNLSVEIITYSSLNLGWEDPFVNIAGYEIFRSQDNNSNYELLSSVSDSTFTDNNVSFGTTYFYKVRSYNSFEFSDFSNEVNILVTSLNNSTNENKYEIYPNPASKFVNVVSKTNEINSYIITDVSGKIIETISNVNNKLFNLDLSTYEPGLYYLIIHNKKSKSAFKLIVNK
jgi:uncharacterized delta-60 repeat protein